MNSALLILIALLIEAAIGWPTYIFKAIAHPVVWIGWQITLLEKWLYKSGTRYLSNYIRGLLLTISVVTTTTVAAYLISRLLPNTVLGFIIECIVTSSLLASRSLYEHVNAVTQPLLQHDLEQARVAVSQIVGRDTKVLDEAGIARASIESLAENASDGIIAPVFWGVIFGLPGIAAYKAINTLDSMIGHKSDRYLAFGCFAAKLDDIANFIPARLTALLFIAVGKISTSLKTLAKEAQHHRSPNAGWPESAMALMLNIRLSGPRNYTTGENDEPWLNGDAQDPTPNDLKHGLDLYTRALILTTVILAVITSVAYF